MVRGGIRGGVNRFKFVLLHFYSTGWKLDCSFTKLTHAHIKLIRLQMWIVIESLCQLEILVCPNRPKGNIL